MKCSVCEGDCWAGSSSGTCSECLRIIIANSAPDEPDEPEEGDWVTDDYKVFHEHGLKGTIVAPTDPQGFCYWGAAVKARMDAEQFWPNVWYVSDHGNYILLSLEDEE